MKPFPTFRMGEVAREVAREIARELEPHRRHVTRSSCRGGDEVLKKSCKLKQHANGLHIDHKLERLRY